MGSNDPGYVSALTTAGTKAPSTAAHAAHAAAQVSLGATVTRNGPLVKTEHWGTPSTKVSPGEVNSTPGKELITEDQKVTYPSGGSFSEHLDMRPDHKFQTLSFAPPPGGAATKFDEGGVQEDGSVSLSRHLGKGSEYGDSGTDMRQIIHTDGSTSMTVVKNEPAPQPFLMGDPALTTPSFYRPPTHDLQYTLQSDASGHTSVTDGHGHKLPFDPAKNGAGVTIHNNGENVNVGWLVPPSDLDAKH
jgi:hypothetical protein